MKNRTRPFDCTIANKVVNIALRHGGGLQEPASVYVRCDERDCQYVDLNTPPCPLRIDMFADGSDRVVADHLQTHAGMRMCYACLTDKLGISHDQVRRASWRLKDEPGISIRPSRCSACRHRRVTIGLVRDGMLAAPPVPAVAPLEPAANGAPSEVDEVATYLRSQPGFAFCAHCLARELGGRPGTIREAMWALENRPDFHIRTTQCVSCLLSKPVIRYDERLSDVDAPRRVIGFLLQSPGVAFCQTCLAFSTDLALTDVRRIVHNLAPVPDFVRRDGACAACGRWQPVVAVGDDDARSSERVSEVGDVLFGTLRYRGLRIDLHSYRTADGWRPFALVKSAAGALVPDAPPILLGLMPTKLDADELAAGQARAWIDKRVP